MIAVTLDHHLSCSYQVLTLTAAVIFPPVMAAILSPVLAAILSLVVALLIATHLLVLHHYCLQNIDKLLLKQAASG